MDDVELAIRSGQLRVHALVESCEAEIITDAPAEIFQNLNTLDEYEDILRRSKRIGGL
jgi:hypothetical protein